MLEMEGERQKRLINQLGYLQREISELEKSKSRLRQNLNLQKSEISKYKILLENLPQGVFYKDINSFYISCNRQYALELGLSAEDICGKTDFDLYPRKVARYYEEADREVIASGGTVESDYEFIQFGKEKTLRITKIPVRNEKDEIIGILGISSNITAAIRAQEELKKSEEAFRLAFENAKDAIIWIDAEKGTIIRCNRSAEKLVEREREELIGCHQLLFYPPEKTEYYEQLIKKQMQPDFTVDEEAEIITSSGKIVPVHMTSSVTSVGGTQIIQAILRDISEKKRWEQEILHRDIIMNEVRFSAEQNLRRIREDFVTTLTHDMKGPLTATLGYLHLLEKPQFGFISEDKKGFVNMIRHNQGVMLSMIENIIDSSTFEAGRMQYKFCSFPLLELVNELPITFGAMAVLARVTLNLQCPDDAWVYADRKAIRRVLNNLVSNAMRYTPPEGMITISVVEEENCQKVMVKDTGKGISSEDMETIFQKYGKARGERRGTGLGLYIVKSFLKDHNSDIQVESTPGSGSTFYFSLEKGAPPHSFIDKMRD